MILKVLLLAIRCPPALTEMLQGPSVKVVPLAVRVPSDGDRLDVPQQDPIVTVSPLAKLRVPLSVRIWPAGCRREHWAPRPVSLLMRP